MAENKKKPSILMLPWLAHGHVSPFLELAKKLSKRNFYIYLCSTPISLEPLKSNLLNDSSIKLVEIHLESTQELPSKNHNTKNLPLHLNSALKAAFDNASTQFSSIVSEINPSLIIYDLFMPWVPLIASQQGIRAVLFLTASVASNFCMLHELEDQETKHPLITQFFQEDWKEDFTGFINTEANGLTNIDRFFQSLERSSSIILSKTSEIIEPKFVEAFSTLAGKELVPVGTLVQQSEEKEDDQAFLAWLNKKEDSSVVFVSFGSEYFLSKDEIKEISHGLELSEVNFIWVLRFHGEQKIKIHEVLPQGFLARIGDKGMVLEGWAPQVKILQSKKIGGFVSHCGWSSTLESIKFGVPIIAMAMHLDQPMNAKLVVNGGFGAEVVRVNGMFTRENMSKVIRHVVVEDEGKNIRKKVKQMSEKMRDEDNLQIDVVVNKFKDLMQDI